MKKSLLLLIAIIVIITTIVIIVTKFSSSSTDQQLTEQEAIELVRSTDEVKEWLLLFSGPNGTSPITGGKPAFNIDQVEENYYLVQVFENLPERTVTFNWYKVNSQTGEVTKKTNP